MPEIGRWAEARVSTSLPAKTKVVDSRALPSATPGMTKKESGDPSRSLPDDDDMQPARTMRAHLQLLPDIRAARGTGDEIDRTGHRRDVLCRESAARSQRSPGFLQPADHILGAQ